METAWVDPFVFVPASLVGGGLILSLAVGLGMPRRRAPVVLLHAVVALAALVAAAFAVIAAALHQPRVLWLPAAIVAGLYVALILIPSPLAVGVTIRLLTLSRRRYARLALMVGLWATCPFLALAILYLHYEPTDTVGLEDLAAQLQEEALPFSLDEVPDSPLTTDIGRPIRAQLLKFPDERVPVELYLFKEKALTRHGLHDTLIDLPPLHRECNCHGFVFTGGRFWVRGEDVELILADNGYQAVTRPRLNDVALYRSAEGVIEHSGIVRGVTTDGIALIESKWGKYGRFVHTHHRHLYPDTVCTFWRSPRPGRHLLRGCGGEQRVSMPPPALLPPAPKEPPSTGM